MTDTHTDKHNGMTIRLTLCERDTIQQQTTTTSPAEIYKNCSQTKLLSLNDRLQMSMPNFTKITVVSLKTFVESIHVPIYKGKGDPKRLRRV